MGILSFFKGGGDIGGNESFAGETGTEDNVIVAIIDETCGADAEKIKEHFHEKGLEISDDDLKAAVEKLVNKGIIYWDKKLERYFLTSEQKKK